MKKELVPFNDMFYVEGNARVWRLSKPMSLNALLLSDITTLEKKTFHINLVKKMKDVLIGTTPIGDVFEKLYALEEADEVPAPSEIKEMESLKKKIGLDESVTPLQLSKAVEMYYQIMELADEIGEIEDPYDNL